MQRLKSAVLLTLAVLFIVTVPTVVNEVGAAWRPGALVRQFVQNRQAARASRCGDCGSACSDCSTPEALAGQAAATQRNAERLATARSEAGQLDQLTGHRLGRGPLYRALHATATQQNRIVARFNQTVGSEHGFQAGSVAEILQWLLDHKSQIIEVVQLVIAIIGMF